MTIQTHVWKSKLRYLFFGLKEKTFLSNFKISYKRRLMKLEKILTEIAISILNPFFNQVTEKCICKSFFPIKSNKNVYRYVNSCQLRWIKLRIANPRFLWVGLG